MHETRPRKTKALGLAAGFFAVSLILSGCSREGELDVSSGVGVYASLDGCPVVAVPNGTGDITLFNPPSSQTASAIDVVATITNVRSNCASGTAQIANQVTFDIIASRVNSAGARQVTLPYYSVVLQAGQNVLAKQIGQVTLNFTDGARVATTQATAQAYIDEELTRLPADVRDRITERREPGDDNAAIDPLSDPRVRAEVRRTTFEHLVGFQLTDEQLGYNVTR